MTKLVENSRVSERPRPPEHYFSRQFLDFLRDPDLQNTIFLDKNTRPSHPKKPPQEGKDKDEENGPKWARSWPGKNAYFSRKRGYADKSGPFFCQISRNTRFSAGGASKPLFLSTQTGAPKIRGSFCDVFPTFLTPGAEKDSFSQQKKNAGPVWKPAAV